MGVRRTRARTAARSPRRRAGAARPRARAAAGGRAGAAGRSGASASSSAATGRARVIARARLRRPRPRRAGRRPGVEERVGALGAHLATEALGHRAARVERAPVDDLDARARAAAATRSPRLEPASASSSASTSRRTPSLRIASTSTAPARRRRAPCARSSRRPRVVLLGLAAPARPVRPPKVSRGLTCRIPPSLRIGTEIAEAPGSSSPR